MMRMFHLRTSTLRGFRVLPTTLNSECLPFEPETTKHKVEQQVKLLEDALAISRAGGSDRAKALHKKRNKLFGMSV